MAAGLTLNFTGWFAPWTQAVLGCAVSYLGIRLFHYIQLRIRGKAGIGLGDAKYLAALGAWFGIQAVPFLLVGASICTLVSYWKRREKPFGVGLSISGMGMWVYAAVTAIQRT